MGVCAIGVPLGATLISPCSPEEKGTSEHPKLLLGTRESGGRSGSKTPRKSDAFMHLGTPNNAGLGSHPLSGG